LNNKKKEEKRTALAEFVLLCVHRSHEETKTLKKRISEYEQRINFLSAAMIRPVQVSNGTPFL
jgi:hypothetical protein